MSAKLNRYPHNPILTSIREHPWESNAVMNASVVEKNGVFHMLYRALDTKQKAFPSGKIYHHSYIGYAESNDGISFTRREEPFIRPEQPWESLGCEDPRVTKIGDSYYIFYTAVTEGKETDLAVKIAGAVTKDFKTITKLGIIELDGRCKAAALFPEKINGKYAFLYTQNADRPNSTIFYAEIESIDTLFDPKSWEKVEKRPLLTPSPNAFRGPELGAVPVKIEIGWLLIYCAQSFKKEWFIGAALLKSTNPLEIIGQTKEPLLQPETAYEMSGYTPNVAFPSGAVITNDTLYIYYGGADSGVCLATTPLNTITSSL